MSGFGDTTMKSNRVIMGRDRYKNPDLGHSQRFFIDRKVVLQRNKQLSLLYFINDSNVFKKKKINVCNS